MFHLSSQKTCRRHNQLVFYFSHFTFRIIFQKYNCTNGAERILPTCPVRLASHGAFPLGKPVMYGDNNEDILEDLGYSPEEIEALKANKTIG